jgi:hypothetical protein
LAYTDTWSNGLDSYLSMMRDRIELLARLLTPSGSIFVHCVIAGSKVTQERRVGIDPPPE